MSRDVRRILCKRWNGALQADVPEGRRFAESAKIVAAAGIQPVFFKNGHDLSSTLSKSDRPGRDSRRWMAAKILTASCSAGRRTVSPDKLSFFQQADRRIAHFPIKQFFRKSLQTFTSINKKMSAYCSVY